MVNDELTKEDPSFETSALDVFFPELQPWTPFSPLQHCAPSLACVSCNTLRCLPAPIPHAVQLLRISMHLSFHFQRFFVFVSPSLCISCFSFYRNDPLPLI